MVRKLLIAFAILAVVLIVAVQQYNNDMSDARDEGTYNGCMFNETEINGLGYADADIKCKMSN